jgi:hypothetical protein
VQLHEFKSLLCMLRSVQMHEFKSLGLLLRSADA